MENSFKKILLRTAFVCMTSDGEIDDREVEIIRGLSKSHHAFKLMEIEKEINQLLEAINQDWRSFIATFFDDLKNHSFSEEENKAILEVAIKTIYADEQVEYSEIKLFKNIRHRLKISDEKIIEAFPQVEQFLEDDIVSDSYLEKIKVQFLETTDIPNFDMIKLIN
jgi:uncharacterized tellurite resistance protein B-like protein